MYSPQKFESSINNNHIKNNPPLWKWLLTPKLREKLHEHRKLPNAPTTTTPSTSSSSNSFVSHEASLWKWRMKMQSIMAQGQPIAVGTTASPTTKNTNTNTRTRSKQSSSSPNYYYSLSNNSHTRQQQKDFSATSHLHPARKKSDFRFAAKTLASNLISEIQSRTLNLVMMNLTPLSRSSVGASRFDTLPEARLASLECLQRSACGLEQSVLSDEFFSWKQCLFRQMMLVSADGKQERDQDDNHDDLVDDARTKPVVVPQEVFIMVGSRIGQLVTLSEESPDDDRVDDSLIEFQKIMERDWASILAQNGHRLLQRICITTSTKADDDEREFLGLNFSKWFCGVLLPVAVILAPPHCSLTDELMIDHTVEFCSTLRSILFPENDSNNINKTQPITRSDDDNSNMNSVHKSSEKRRIVSSAVSPKNHHNKTSPSVVVGGGDPSKNLIHHSFAYEQRLMTTGFPSRNMNTNTDIASPNSAGSTNRREVAPAPATASSSLFVALSRRSNPQQPNSPSSLLSSPSKFQQQQQQQQQRPMTSPSASASSCSKTLFSSSSSPLGQRKLPKAIEELVFRQQIQQQLSPFSNTSSSDYYSNQRQQYPSSEEILQRVHQSSDGRKTSPHSAHFRQPFPRNLVCEKPEKTLMNVEEKTGGAPLHLVQMKFRGNNNKQSSSSSPNSFGKEKSPTMPKNEYQKQKEAQIRKYKEMMMKNKNQLIDSSEQHGDTSMNDEHSAAALGDLPEEAHIASKALGIHVRSSPTRFLTSTSTSTTTRSSSPLKKNKSEDLDDNSPSRKRSPSPPTLSSATNTTKNSPERKRSFIHSRKLGRHDSILNVTSVKSKEEEEAEIRERERLRRVAMSSTGRSLKNRAPTELHTRILPV